MAIAKRAYNLVRDQDSARAELSEFLGGATKAVSELIDDAPRTPLNGPITQHRRFRLVRNSVDDFKQIKKLLDTTLNDVVLAVTSDALGRWLRYRYFPTDGLKLRALVPVSTRPKKRRGEDTHTGNDLLAMRGYLPVEEMDTLKRLSYVKNSMDGLKRSNQAVAADALTAVQNFAPPTVLAQASRLNFSTRIFNLLVTNVPGPQLPLYLLDRQMIDAFPIPFLAENHRVAIAVLSYNGRLNFGILADYDAVPDVQVIADGISDARDDLLAATAEVRTRVREAVAEDKAKAAAAADIKPLAAVADGAAKTVSKAKSRRSPNGAAASSMTRPAAKKPAAKKPAAKKAAAKKPATKRPAAKAKPAAKKSAQRSA
jgi:WS/DGAT/MGAT family acyltransferase